MSVHSYNELAYHRGHNIQCVTYGGANAALECINCGAVLIDFDNDAPTKTYSVTFYSEIVANSEEEAEATAIRELKTGAAAFDTKLAYEREKQ